MFSEIDLSQLLYSFWRVGIIMSKLKNKLCINYHKYYIKTHFYFSKMSIPWFIFDF